MKSCINAVFWSRRRDSNPRPLRPERNALPTALRLVILRFHYSRNAYIITNAVLKVNPFSRYDKKFSKSFRAPFILCIFHLFQGFFYEKTAADCSNFIPRQKFVNIASIYTARRNKFHLGERRRQCFHGF